MDELTWANARRLHFGEKMSKRAIARHLGIARDTVRDALASAQCPRRWTSPRGSALDPFEEFLKDTLVRYPALSVVRLLEKLREVGYAGGVSILKRRVRLLRPRPQREAFIKRETLPGEEAQVDWGSCGQIVVDGTIRPLSVFVMVLSHSRLMYVEFTVSQEMEDFLRGHVNAFAAFGGRCPRVILYDNLKSVVTWRQKRLIKFNSRFQEFAGTYLFEARPCNVRRGNEKPRAETGVRYVKQNFLAGREFRDLADVRVQAFHWLRDVANVRIHQTTRQRPIDRFEQERDHLQAAPAAAVDTRICRMVAVSHQARVSFQTNTYSVPPRWVDQSLTLKAGPDRVWLYALDQEVACHVRWYGRHRDIEDPAHAKAILATKPRGRPHKERDELLALGPLAEKFLEGLVHSGAGNPDFHVGKLLSLVEDHGQTRVLQAMDYAIGFGAYGADIVANILHQRLGPDFVTRRPSPLDLTTRPDLAAHTTDCPDLAEYGHLTDLEVDSDEDVPR